MARTNIEKNVVKRHGRWYLRKMLHGVHHEVDLYASSKAQAIGQARKEWKRILTGEAVETTLSTKRKRIPAIGELRKPYLDAALKCSHKGRCDNFTTLCLIIREALGITKKEAMALSTAKAITPEVLSVWIKLREDRPPRLTKAELAARQPHEISKPGKLTPFDLNRVRGTIISTITHARSVFCVDGLDPDSGYLRSFNIPELKGFMRVVLPEVEERVWNVPSESKIDAIVGALPDLEKKSPAVFIGILLGLGMGLRRGEIINARWSQFFWEDKQPKLKLGATHDWRGTKGKRERVVPIPGEVYAKLIEHQDNETYLVPDKREAAEVIKRGKGHFSTQRPGAGKTGPNAYRKSTSGSWGMAADCNRWLTSVGWDRRQKLHEMRKYFGAMVVTETGSLYEAQQLLGHQNVNTTRDSYAGLTKRTQYTGAIDARLGLASTG